MSSRKDYIDALEVNSLIAFKLDKLEAKMYSGKVTKIGKTKVEVETKNGRKYFINKEDIHWVNIAGKWPTHIMQALRGIDYEETNSGHINNQPIIEKNTASHSEALEDIIPEPEPKVDIKLVDDEIIEVDENGGEELSKEEIE